MVRCLNEDFDAHDEYVYSIRKVTVQEYNDKLVLGIQGKRPVHLRIALKVPNMRWSGLIRGSLLTQVHSLDDGKIYGFMDVLLLAQVDNPEIICPKVLHSSTIHN
jgi:hypothetical protein